MAMAAIEIQWDVSGSYRCIYTYLYLYNIFLQYIYIYINYIRYTYIYNNIYNNIYIYIYNNIYIYMGERIQVAGDFFCKHMEVSEHEVTSRSSIFQ